jgi:hypothetical protein
MWGVDKGRAPKEDSAPRILGMRWAEGNFASDCLQVPVLAAVGINLWAALRRKAISLVTVRVRVQVRSPRRPQGADRNGSSSGTAG